MAYKQFVMLGSWASAPSSWVAPNDGILELVVLTIDPSSGTDSVLSTVGVSTNTAINPGVICALNNAVTSVAPITVSFPINFPVLKGQKLFGQGYVSFYFATP